MITPSSKLWSVIVANIPLGEWQSLDSLYQIVEDNYSNFTEEDLGPTMEGFPQEKWKHSVRNVIQNKKTKGEIEHDGQGNYRIERPYVWRMVLEAVRELPNPCSYGDIREFIRNRWEDVNEGTLTAQIIMMTVNHISRIHYPENHKERRTDVGSVYDQLYKLENGSVELYDSTVHGVWGVIIEDGSLCIMQYSSGKVYTPLDIKWIKHVTNTEGGTAYMELEDDVFTLHFPGVKIGNIQRPEKGEIILLYQKINNEPCFTHLVTPINDEIVDEGVRPNYRYGRRVKVLALVDMDNLIPLQSTSWSQVNFRGIAQGNVCEVDSSSPVDSFDALRLDTWRRFEPFFTNEMSSEIRYTNTAIDDVEQEDSNISGQEGRLKLVNHYVRERNRKIVAEKKKQAKKSDPELKCEVCNFSFLKTFSQDFIECHHITPISEAGESETRLEDLALVCANCHRMLHKKFDGEYLSIQELSIKRSQFE